MRSYRINIWVSIFALLILFLVSCAGRQRAMSRYYRNHPEMQRKLLVVRTIYLEDVQRAESKEDALKMKEALIDELSRKGKGRFRLASSASRADAILKTDMEEELGPVGPEEEPLPFELEPKIVIEGEVYLRMKLVDPKTNRLIYKTDTEELNEFEVDSIGKAAHIVIKNLMREIDSANRSFKR